MPVRLPPLGRPALLVADGGARSHAADHGREAFELAVRLGATAAKALLGGTFRVTQHRGELMERETPAGVRRLMATVHPSSVLRGPPERRDEAYAALVADLRVAADLLTG
jgi:DNA polymerase